MKGPLERMWIGGAQNQSLRASVPTTAMRSPTAKCLELEEFSMLIGVEVALFVPYLGAMSLSLSPPLPLPQPFLLRYPFRLTIVDFIGA